MFMELNEVNFVKNRLYALLNPKDNLIHSFFHYLKDAKKDESVRKSYKYLAALHEVRDPVSPLPICCDQRTCYM